MLNAKPSVQHPTVPGPGGRKLANMDCDYKTFNKFIDLANARDAKAEKMIKFFHILLLKSNNIMLKLHEQRVICRTAIISLLIKNNYRNGLLQDISYNMAAGKPAVFTI